MLAASVCFDFYGSETEAIQIIWHPLPLELLPAWSEPTGPIIPWEFTAEGRSFEVRVPGQLMFNEPELMLGGALDGLGVAYLLEHEAVAHIANGMLTPLPADWMASFPGFFLYYPSRPQLRPVFAALLDVLRRPQT